MGDAEFFARVKEVMKTGYWELGHGHGGTGGVGQLLEELLGVDGGNSDTPDGGKWEIKTHTGKGNLLTLFHKTGTPNMRCILDSVYSYHPNGDVTKPRTYRNTIYGGTPNSQGFYADTSHSLNRVTLFNVNDHPRVAYSS
ncbi:MAG: hypothetical protein F4X48_03695 [Acidimicrobiia bacterium]|nr:hypothetical protein [Acidimicrobiia bacterium]MYC57677.1 hypothetical protein [Acidimicrobiia bacterium]MYI31201.1 hypothetical protein [Acidimicrobiia bacterium]